MAYALSKRLFDVIVATLLLVVTIPVWVCTAIVLLLIQGRPILFRQRRIGLHGQPFTLMKFRTMVAGTPQHLPDRPVAKVPGDPRVTPFGRFLRRFAIDELPQLLNVLRGEMSMVGPRPLPQEDLAQPGWLKQLPEDERARRLEWVTRRHQTPPGLTGRWQITARPAEDFENWIVCDLAYVAHHSRWDDLLILLKTPFAVLRGRQDGVPHPDSAPCRQSREDSV